MTIFCGLDTYRNAWMKQPTIPYEDLTWMSNLQKVFRNSSITIFQNTAFDSESNRWTYTEPFGLDHGEFFFLLIYDRYIHFMYNICLLSSCLIRIFSFYGSWIRPVSFHNSSLLFVSVGLKIIEGKWKRFATSQK